jgi:hypothetical protein
MIVGIIIFIYIIVMDVPILDLDPVYSVTWEKNLSEFGRHEILLNIFLFSHHSVTKLRQLLLLVLEVITISRLWCLVLAKAPSIQAPVTLALVWLFIDKQEIFVHYQADLDVFGKQLDPFIFLFDISIVILSVFQPLIVSGATISSLRCLLLIVYRSDESITGL